MERVFGGFTTELMDQWKRGVLDGLELAAQCIEHCKTNPELAENAYLFEGLVFCLREAGLRFQLDIEGI